MGKQDTRERILDSAERLFSEHGFAATSLRSITAEGEVNLAAVNYHFGTKEGLIREVFGRRIRPLNRDRLEMLELLEREAGDGPAPLEGLIEAFVGPGLRMAQDPRRRGVITKLIGRTYTEPSDELRKLFFEQFREIKERFGAAFQRTLPDLTEEDLFWRLHFVIGVMAQTMADPHRLHVLSEGRCDPLDVEATIAQLVPFIAGGLRAAGVSSAAKGKR